MSAKCEHLNGDGTFKGGFEGCMLHMQADCGGGHSEESAKKICGKIAQEVGAKRPGAGASLGPALMARMSVAAPETEIGEFMFMPGGTHTARFRQGGRAVTRTVTVDPAAAGALEEQRNALQARSPQRPFFDFDHKDGAASGWPLAFFWRQSPEPGVFCRAEWSAAGVAAIKGKSYRAFSGVFHVDRNDPAHVICREDADLNMGGLVNDPAFQKISPLWAKQTRAGAHSGGGENSPELNNQNQGKTVNTAAETDLATVQAELDEAKGQMKARRAKDAEEAVDAAVRRGAIAPKNEPLKAKWRKWATESDEMLGALNEMEGNLLLTTGSITRSSTALAMAGSRLQASEGPARILAAYGALAAKNSGIKDLSPAGFQRKGVFSREMAVLYGKEIAPRYKEFSEMPLIAADVSDANLGTLSGTLVAQRTLELFKWEFPVLTEITTDFSDLPAQYLQTEMTRIVVVPTTQEYSTTPDGTGRPVGWSTVVAAQTVDVPITLDKHIGVPIVFDSNTLASTVRRLFDEIAPAAAYAVAKYFVNKLYALFIPANYNAYAAVVAGKVPTAYAKFPVALSDVGRSTLTKIGAILNQNEVPLSNRVALWNSEYFAQISCDPSLVTFFAGQRAPEIVTESQLPRMARFQPIEAPNLPTTNNMVGMALHKAGAVIKARLSNDYTQALPGSSYGSVTTITNPDIGISMVLVQYVNHTGGYAEWRLQVMLGAAVGDKRGGLCITSS